MKRFSTLLRGKGSKDNSDRTHSASDLDNDSPEGSAAHAVRLFCEGASTANRDEEVLHLPTIVDAAESSPAAAAACATQIRIFLSKKYLSKSHVQYNAIMLIRILSDHPGPSFTRNFDDKFVRSVKTTLREGEDLSVNHLLRETLESISTNLPHDAGVQGLIQMWTREKTMPGPYNRLPVAGHHPAAATRPRPPPPQRGQLPPQQELASRVEESRNTAKILIQFLQTTPSEEIATNELIKEFADRCQSAQRSMQTFINCENPPPDDDTLQTLIETNEQLSLASSRHQRAVLAARRAQGLSPSPKPESRTGSYSMAPPQPERQSLVQQNDFGSQPNGFGSQQNGTVYTAPLAYQPPLQQADQPLAIPPAPRQQQNVSIPSQSPSRVLDNDDHDDLYDSPKASKALLSNPFSDPEDQPLPSTLSAGNARPTSPSKELSPQQQSPPRPAPGPWHNSTITSSFLGRQASAADGLTMHAPGAVSEIDGHSKVGRGDYRDAQGAAKPQTTFSVTHAPPDASTATLSRVDIAGTGGFKAV